MTMDERIVSDILFGDQSKMGQFRGGGDKVGAALANFINARNDARNRALRNEMFDRFMQDNYGQNPNRPNVTQGNGNESLNQFLQYRQQQQPQVGQSEVADAWNKMAPRGGYFAQGINSVEQPNEGKYSFNESEYIPNAQNGYHLGDYKQTEMFGNPTDYQRQKAINAMGLNYDDQFKIQQKEYFPMNRQGLDDNTMNIKDQTIGQNYNQRIDSQYNNGAMGGANGMNIPRAPQNGFRQAIGNAENSVLQNSYKDVWGNNPNPSSPAVDNQTVQTTDGAQSVPQSKYQELVNRLASSKYLNDGYDFDSWAQRAREDGITGGALQNVMYNQRIRPLVEQAREDRLRESFRIANDESLDQKTRLDAIADLAYSIKNPDIAHDVLYKREAEDRARQKWEWEKAKMDALEANGFAPLSGGSGVGRGRPRGSGSSTKRTKGLGIDSSLLDEDLIDSLKSFKADSTSQENFDNMIGNMRALKARLMQERDMSNEDAGSLAGALLKKSLGNVYYKLPQKQKKFLMNSFNGIDSYGENPQTQNPSDKKLAGQGYIDLIKKAAEEKFNKLTQNGNMNSYEDNQPSGAVLDGVYFNDETLNNLAKEKAKLEEARKNGTFGIYGENGFGSLPKGEVIRRSQELQQTEDIPTEEEIDMWKQALGI